MPPVQPLADDDIADILRKEASRNPSQHRSSRGLGSLLSSNSSLRQRGHAPKPNTRFLRNIIRETDSHNAALKAKESAETRARLHETTHQKRSPIGLEHSRDDHPRSRKRSRSRDRHPREPPNSASSRRKLRRREPSVDAHARSRSPLRPAAPTAHTRHHSERSRSPRPRRKRDRARASPDSDPLEDIIGPLPPPKVVARGRGAHKVSAIDARFADGYDPALDVDLELDEQRDDWDMALEALRDQAKWKKGRSERLRAAGFTDEEVVRFEEGKESVEDGGGKEDWAGVRWRKRGEGREWDRGKRVDGGRVDVGPEWT